MNRSGLRWIAWFALAAVLPPAAAAGQAAAIPSRADTLAAIHLLQRATFGARPADVAAVLTVGPETWLDRQLHPETIDDSALEARLELFPGATASPARLFELFPPPTVDAADRLGSPGRIVADLALARLHRSVRSERQLEEVMTQFWFNHFNVDFTRDRAKWLVGDYERRAIRPNVFGRFEDLLVATARHPAMLVYLDNWRSRAPDPASPRPDREKGINENYARELMELHTLGVDGGYDERDVAEVARAFTGWTVVGLSEREALDRSLRGVRYEFLPELHDPGSKTVMGETVGPAGEAEGVAILRRLARHPGTARRIARRLGEAFVADEPPPALVDELERVFLATDGDLRAVTRALFLSAPFRDPAARAAKLRTPFELMAAALRMTGVEFGRSTDLPLALQELDQMPYMTSPPTGYPEDATAWLGGGAILGRARFALALATGRLDGVETPAWAWGEASPEHVAAMATALLPGTDTEALERAVLADVGAAGPAGPRPAARALALVLGSPAFQRQ